jgi:hypothetical protein
MKAKSIATKTNSNQLPHRHIPELPVFSKITEDGDLPVAGTVQEGSKEAEEEHQSTATGH